MKHNIFSVYDEKAKSYITPMFMPEIGMAIRIFSDCINDPGHQFSKHPADYTLFHLGAWADNTSAFDPLPTCISLGNGITFVDKKNDTDQIPLLEAVE